MMYQLTALVASMVFDFTRFEDDLFPAWQGLFRVGPAPGEFSLLPDKNVTSFYGTTDMVYALHAVGQLDAVSCAERVQWAATINEFQNASSGWIRLMSWEQMHTANPPYANYTWHAIGAAIETLQLLGSADCHGVSPSPSPFVLAAPVLSVGALLAQGPSEWEVFMHRWLTDYADVWMGSQAIQSLAAVVKLARINERIDGDAREEFFSWFFSYLNLTVSNSTGMWDGAPSQNLMHQLGGAFHLQHVYECFDGEYKWPNPSAAVDSTLIAQHKGANG